MTTSISNRELVDAYIKFRGFHRLNGDGNDISCLVPLILLDMHLQLYDTSISKIPCRHETQRARTRWRECYNKFNRGSFLAFNREYKNQVIDLMDDLTDFTANNVMFLRVAVMDVFKDQASLEDQDRIADIVICNTFAQIAVSWWGSTFKRVSPFNSREYLPEHNGFLEGMARRSKEFLNGFINDTVHYSGFVNLQDHPSVVNATEALDRRVSEWADAKNQSNG